MDAVTQHLFRLVDKLIRKKGKSRLASLGTTSASNELQMENIDSVLEEDDCAILGDPKSKNSIKCLLMTKAQLEELENNPKVNTHLALAKSLFQHIFKEELDTRPLEVSCTDTHDNKEVLNKTYLKGIRSECVV